jgi:hypothetical protein
MKGAPQILDQESHVYSMPGRNCLNTEMQRMQPRVTFILKYPNELRFIVSSAITNT